MGVASEERRQLCDLLEQVGPDAPTLCAGWVARDLAVHLVMREQRPDALAGRLVKVLADRGERVRGELRDKPWHELVDQLRQGPQKWNPLGMGPVDEVVNSAEFFVHHEDVRRAQSDWRARPADSDREEALWKALSRAAKVFYGRSPVGVSLRRPDGTEIAAKQGPRTVRVFGEPSELTMYVFGREQADVSFEGAAADIRDVADSRRSF